MINLENIKEGDFYKYDKIEEVAINNKELDYINFGNYHENKHIYQVFNDNKTWTFVLKENDYLKCINIG